MEDIRKKEKEKSNKGGNVKERRKEKEVPILNGMDVEEEKKRKEEEEVVVLKKPLGKEKEGKTGGKARKTLLPSKPGKKEAAKVPDRFGTERYNLRGNKKRIDYTAERNFLVEEERLKRKWEKNKRYRKEGYGSRKKVHGGPGGRGFRGGGRRL